LNKVRLHIYDLAVQLWPSYESISVLAVTTQTRLPAQTVCCNYSQKQI